MARRVDDCSRLTQEKIFLSFTLPSFHYKIPLGTGVGHTGGEAVGRAGAMEASAEERKASSPEQKELLSTGPSYS